MTTSAPTAPHLTNSLGPEVLPHRPLVHAELPAAYQQAGDDTSHQEAVAKTAQRQPSPISVALIAFSVAALLLGGIIGGVLGSKLSSCQSKLSATSSCSPSTSPRPSSTASASPLKGYVAEPASNVDTVRLDCPALNNQQITTHTGSKFSLTCGFNIEFGGDAVGGGVVADIAGIIAYSVYDCAAACSGLTQFSNEWDTDNDCQSFTFNAILKNTTDAMYGANCYLKNGTLEKDTDMKRASRSAKDLIVSGKVV